MIPPTTSMGLSSASSSSQANFPNFPGLPALMASLGDRSQTSIYPSQHQPQLSDSSHAQEYNVSDLERLERLKREILDGQNPIYKAVPRPDYLKSLYLGRLPQEKSPSPIQRSEITQAAPSAEASGASSQVRVKQEEVENPLAGIQMSDILALSSKLLKRDSFTFSNGANGIEALKKPEAETNGNFSNAVHSSHSHSRGASHTPAVAQAAPGNGSMAPRGSLEQRMRSPNETLGASDPPYDPKEGLSSSSLDAHLPGNKEPGEVYIGHASAPGKYEYPTGQYTHYGHGHQSMPSNGYRSQGPSPYDVASAGSRNFTDRGMRYPMEEREALSDHLTLPERPNGSLQDRIGKKVPLAATPLATTPGLSPTPSAGYHPHNNYDELSRDHASRHPPLFDASEEVIRQAILEREAASEDRGRPLLEDRIDRERTSFPPKFAAKRSHGYGSPHPVLPPPPPSPEREPARRWSNASRPTGDSPIRTDSHGSGPASSKPLSWDREGPIEPPAVYPPPPPSDYDARTPYGGYHDYPRSRPGGRSPSPPPHLRRSSGEYGALRPGMKRGREDDMSDGFDRRYAGFGRGPMSANGGYYDDRTPYAYDYDRRAEDLPPPRGMYRPDPSYIMPPPRTA